MGTTPITIEDGTLQIGNGEIAGNHLYYSPIQITSGCNLEFKTCPGNTISTYLVYGAGGINKLATEGKAIIKRPWSSGKVSVQGGVLQLNREIEPLYGDPSSYSVASGATLRFETDISRKFQTEVISGAGNVEFYIPTGKTIEIHKSQTYTGKTTITGGGDLHLIQDGWIQGDIINYARHLVFKINAAKTFSKVISRTDSVHKYNSNALTLTGENTYEGETRIFDGRLVIGNEITGSISYSKRIFLDSPTSKLDFLPGYNTCLVRGEIETVAGSKIRCLCFWDTRTLHLAGGGSIDDFELSGRLWISTKNLYIAKLYMEGALIFNNDNNFTFESVLSGSGSITKYGTGKLDMHGTLLNNFSGNIEVAAGTLVVPAKLGDNNMKISDPNAILRIETDKSGTQPAYGWHYNGIISGTGKVEFKGTGDGTGFFFANNNTYTGSTTVEKGYIGIGPG